MTSPLSHAIISKPSHDSSWVALPVSTPSAYDPAAHLDREHSVLHELHLIHTDLKPENILLVNNGYKHVTVPIPGKVLIISISVIIRTSLTPPVA